STRRGRGCGARQVPPRGWRNLGLAEPAHSIGCTEGRHHRRGKPPFAWFATRCCLMVGQFLISCLAFYSPDPIYLSFKQGFSIRRFPGKLRHETCDSHFLSPSSP